MIVRKVVIKLRIGYSLIEKKLATVYIILLASKAITGIAPVTVCMTYPIRGRCHL